jgi:3-deoxy-manno-octulosonate cytidylyltransferase (CMP-KDO synthetase)
MLLRESGHFLFEHTVRNVERAPSLSRVVLATDSSEIVAAAESVGVEALMTTDEHPSGTDRVHEAYQLVAADDPQPWDVIINVQGDEPELPPGDIELLVSAFADPAVELATLCTPIMAPELQCDLSVVKVVCNAAGDAMYFSRSPVPARHPAHMEATPRRMLRHIGVYAFRPAALARFCALPTGQLEAIEGLEQLRWLEAGGRLRVLQVSQAPPGIDDAQQYAAFVARSTKRGHPSPPKPSGRSGLSSVQSQSA